MHLLGHFLVSLFLFLLCSLLFNGLYSLLYLGVSCALLGAFRLLEAMQIPVSRPLSHPSFPFPWPSSQRSPHAISFAFRTRLNRMQVEMPYAKDAIVCLNGIHVSLEPRIEMQRHTYHSFACPGALASCPPRRWCLTYWLAQLIDGDRF